jgi:hypothetical protein
MNILIDLFDHSGHAAEPYKRNNWHVFQVDIKHGIDILEWDYKNEIMDFVADLKYIDRNMEIKFGLLAAVPCTDYALCGATHFKKKDTDGRTEVSQLLVDKTKEIIDWLDVKFGLLFWRVENPMSRIHSLNKWLGPVKFKFNPCDFSGYNHISESEWARLNALEGVKMSEAPKSELQLVMDKNLYNKETWLWGQFNHPEKRFLQPIWKEFPGHILYGGKSERTKELRSVDPKGFCQAFYEANH